MITTSLLIPRVKLEKLKIEIYRKRERRRPDKIANDFVAMFNPESFIQEISNDFNQQPGVAGTISELGYGSTTPRKLNFKLIVDDSLKTNLSSNPLDDRIEKFMKTAAFINGDIHEPPFLRVKWGTYSFDCRIESLEVKYTLFDRGGNALRAELDVAFLEDVTTQIKQRQLKLSSPDLTHIKVVKKGDTLPMMAKEIYGSPNYYIQVALHNKLDNFRKLQPGMKIHFPPIQK